MKAYRYQSRQPFTPWEILVFIIAGISLVLFLTSCGIEHATQRVLTNEGARNKVGRAWADLNPCVKDSIVHYKSDTTVKHDTVSHFIRSTDTLNRYQVDTMVEFITKTIRIHDTTRIDNTDMRAVHALQSDTAYLYGQVRQWKDRAAESKKEASKWLWSFIGACVGAALGIGLYLRSIFTRLPKIK